MTDYQLRYKPDHWWMCLINSNAVTTLAPFIYLPSRAYILTQDTLRHELKHIEQQNRLGLAKFLFLYSMPMPLGLLAILAAFAPLFVPMLWSLCFIVFFLPIWPAMWRVRFEIEGYVAGSRQFSLFEENEADTTAIFQAIKSITYWGACSWYPSDYILRQIRQEKRRQHT